MGRIIQRFACRGVLGFAMLLGFIWHALKGYGNLASIFPDERTYSFAVRLQSFAEVTMPNYLYYAVYRLINLIDMDFLDAARLLNAIFFTLASLFIFAIARRFCSEKVAVIIAILSLFAPSSLLVVLFLIDPFYYFVFWMLAWFYIRFGTANTPRAALLTGVGLGLLTLVKVHGIFLFCGYLLFLLIHGFVVSRDRTREVVGKSILYCLAGFSATKFGLGYAFAGVNGLTVFGRTYTELAAGGNPVDVPAFLYGIAYNATGQLLGILLLYGAPLLFAFTMVAARDTQRGRELDKKLLLLFLCLLCSLVCASAAFNALLDFVQKLDSDYQAARLQARYHFFLYPGYLMIAGYWLRQSQKGRFRFSPLASRLAVATLIFILPATVTGFGLWEFTAIDFPELSTLVDNFTQSTVIIAVFCALAMVPLAALLFRRKRAPSVYLFLFVPVFTVYSLIAFQIPLLWLLRDSGDLGATTLWLRDYLGREKREVMIYDKYAKVAEILAFYLEEKDVRVFHGVADGTILTREDIPQDIKWVILHGKMRLAEGMSLFSMDLQGKDEPGMGFTFELHRLAPFSYSVALDQPSPGWPVEEVIRSGENEIMVQYARDLPSKFYLGLRDPSPSRGDPASYEVRVVGRQRPYRVKATVDGSGGVEVRGDTIGNGILVRKLGGGGALETSLEVVIREME